MSEIDKEKENFSFEHLNLLSDKIISANLIRSIWFFNISPTIFYLGVLDPKKSLSIIDSTKFDEYKLFLSYLSKSRGNYVTNIKRFLSIRYSRLKNYTSTSNGNNVNQSPAFFDSAGDEMIIFQQLYEFYMEEHV